MPFQSTGQAVAGTLQDILARKKAEAQQAVVNAASQRRLDSEIANQAENTASLKVQREASAAKLSADTEDRTLKNLGSRGYNIGDQPDLSPDDASFARAHGLMDDNGPMGPQPDSPDGTPAKHGGYWKGTKADQDQLQMTGDIDQMFAGLDPADPNTKRLQLQLPLLKLMLAQGKGTPAEIAQMMKPDPALQPDLLYESDSHKWVQPPVDPTTGRPMSGAHINVVPHSPQESNRGFSNVGPLTGDTTKQVVLDQNTGTFVIRDLPSAIGPKPTTPHLGASTFPSALRSQLIGGYQNLVTNNTPENKTIYNKVVANVIQALPTTLYPQEVKDGVAELYAAYGGKPWNEVATKVQVQPGQAPMTPSELSQFQELWGMINSPTTGQ